MFRRMKAALRGDTGFEGVAGAPGPMGPKGDTGAPGRDWDALEATWTPLEGTDLDRFPHPVAAHVGDAAVDLQTTHRVVLAPHTTVDAHTGWTVELHPLTSGEVLSRSGLSGRGVIVANAPGLVDSGYRGEVIARLHNLSDSRVVLEAGDRVAQFRVVPTVRPVALEDSPARGEDGLGSTGLDGFPTAHVVGTTKDGYPVFATAGDGVVTWSDDKDALERLDRNPETKARVEAALVPDPADWREVPHPGEAEDRAEPDMVSHPPHYENHPIFPGECWDYTKWLTPAQYAAAKYLWRYNAKGDPAENLQKALWYMVHAEDGFDTPMIVNLRDVPGGADLYNRLDAALTTAEVGVLRQQVDIPVADLYAGMAFLHVIRGQIDAAMSSTGSALDHLD